METTVKGRKFEIQFDPASQGFRMTVMEYAKNKWQILPDYNYVLCIMQTEFEALCNLSSDLFGEAVYGEDFAEQLGIPLIGSDDAECSVCGNFSHYEDMLPDGQWGYTHQECHEQAVA